MPALNKLNPEDIDEKIRINHKDGVDIYALHLSLIEEQKDCRWVELRAKVYCQTLLDEVDDLEKKIVRGWRSILNTQKNRNLRGLIKSKLDEVKNFRGQQITSECQCQFYIEQIAHIEKRIKEIKSKKYEYNPFSTDNYKEKITPAPLLR